MKLNPFILSSAAVITLGCVVTAAAYYYKSRNKEINDVMVFCKLQFNAWNCFDKLISYIDGAKISVNVCMPSIQNPAIQGRLVQLLEKGVKVQIIMDRNGYNDSTDFFIKELIEAGAEIKCRVGEPYNNKHKFCVIDDKILMTGTLNWGDDRSSDGWNYVYITNKPQLVEPVKREFNQMWSIDVNLEQALRIEDTINYSDVQTEEDPQQDTEIVQDESEIQNLQTLISLDEVRQKTPELCF